MDTNMKTLKRLCIFLAIAWLLITPVFAGELSTEEEIKHEISFLAKKLLDITGKDSYVVESPAVIKPFLGVCSSFSPQGVTITCVTPGSGAAQGGLKTGDILSEINNKNLLNPDEEKVKEAFHLVIKTMQSGDVLKLTVFRGKETMILKPIVGSVSHPAYLMEINRHRPQHNSEAIKK